MKRIIGVGLVVLILGLGGLLVRQILITKPAPKPQPARPAQMAQKAQPLDPLQIEAMRQRQYQASPIIKEQDIGERGGYSTQVISFRSDGLKEYALQSVPDSPPPAGGYPVIILAHGYVNPADYRTDSGDYSSWIDALAKVGFVVIKPDYRGHGRSEGTPEGGHFSPVYAYDLLNLIASLKEYRLVNKSRIGLLGHSLGGHVALRTIVVSPDVKATVLANGVVGSMYDLFYNWPRSPAPNDRPAVVQMTRQKLVSKYGDPKSNPDFWNSVSAINYVSSVAGSVQIDTDVGDSTVPRLFSDHLDSALRQVNKKVDYYQYSGDDHQFSSATNHQLFLSRMADFFKANL